MWERSAQYNSEEAEKNREWQEHMASTMYQRAVKDMKAAGLIFSNIHDASIPELTKPRTMASIPFGGRYRLIDFALSDMVEAGVTNVAVLAQKNYQSLMDHLGAGKDWDLSRKNGGLVIFPPFSSYKSDSVSASRLELLNSIKSYINKQNPEVVILTDSDSVNAVNISEVLKQHDEKRAPCIRT